MDTNSLGDKMFIKNLKSIDNLILGINLEVNELIPLTDMGTAEQIKKGANEILEQIKASDSNILFSTL